MKDEDADEIETTRTIGGTLGLPWLGLSVQGQHVKRRLRDRRQERGQQFVADACAAAGLTADQAAAQLVDDEDLAELTARAGERAVGCRDEPYRRRLSELVGAALADTARLDVVEYYTDVAVALEPICLRALGVMADWPGSDVVAGDDDELLMFHAAGRIHVSRLAQTLSVDVDVAQSMIDRLCGLGLATVEPMSDESYVHVDRKFAEATSAGRTLLAYGRPDNR